MHTDCPLKDIARVLFAQTKDAMIVCVIWCQITNTRIHTLPKRLASARHNNTMKTVFLLECTLQTDQSVKTKKRMMYSPGGPYIMVAPVVTSWAVAGQRDFFIFWKQNSQPDYENSVNHCKQTSNNTFTYAVCYIQLCIYCQPCLFFYGANILLSNTQPLCSLPQKQQIK